MFKDRKNLWRDLFKVASDNVKRGESGSTGCADGVFSRVRTDEIVLSQNTLSTNASIQPIIGANGKRVSVSSKKKKEKERTSLIKKGEVWHSVLWSSSGMISRERGEGEVVWSLWEFYYSLILIAAALQLHIFCCNVYFV